MILLTSSSILLSSPQKVVLQSIARREGMIRRYETPFLDGRGAGFLFWEEVSTQISGDMREEKKRNIFYEKNRYLLNDPVFHDSVFCF